jgi:hypothetical protein
MERLLEGALLAKGPYVDWASLLRRTFGFDVLACPRCGAQMRVISMLHDPQEIAKILRHTGQPTRAPPLERARAPSRGRVEAR